MFMILTWLKITRMTKVCENWTLEELCDMSEADMDILLRNYEKGDIPSFEEVRLGNVGIIGFDGSFGWW